MIVSKLKLDFVDAPWASVDGARTKAQQLFDTVTGRTENLGANKPAQRMSLGELLYSALVEPMEMAR